MGMYDGVRKSQLCLTESRTSLKDEKLLWKTMQLAYPESPVAPPTAALTLTLCCLCNERAVLDLCFCYCSHHYQQTPIPLHSASWSLLPSGPCHLSVLSVPPPKAFYLDPLRQKVLTMLLSIPFLISRVPTTDAS